MSEGKKIIIEALIMFAIFMVQYIIWLWKG